KREDRDDDDFRGRPRYDRNRDDNRRGDFGGRDNFKRPFRRRDDDDDNRGNRNFGGRRRRDDEE
ncbi:MAG: hypothetical protein J6U08_00295, partial [Paludibacteraceae bacterium]|nr:hypothetical protein [Paludibacteraceae bacterium]